MRAFFPHCFYSRNLSLLAVSDFNRNIWWFLADAKRQYKSFHEVVAAITPVIARLGLTAATLIELKKVSQYCDVYETGIVVPGSALNSIDLKVIFLSPEDC